MQELKTKIDKQLKGIEELYDYYLIKLEEFPENDYYNRRLDELRVEKSTLENVILMIEKQESFEVNEE